MHRNQLVILKYSPILFTTYLIYIPKLCQHNRHMYEHIKFYVHRIQCAPDACLKVTPLKTQATMTEYLLKDIENVKLIHYKLVRYIKEQIRNLHQ